jgi:hypothetical protein
MTMTELIGMLESDGWRFQLRDGHVSVRIPSPRPDGADAHFLELSRRREEAIGFLRARADADRLRELFGLPELPVFYQTPLPEGRVLSFPARIKSTQPAPMRRRS